MTSPTLRLTLLAALLAPAASSCGSDDATPAPKTFHYARDGELRLTHMQVKATHNSYHVETPGNTLPDWKYTMPPLDVQLARDGVRSVELDVHFKGDGAPIEVHHLPLLDETTTCPTLVACLTTLKVWSDAHPAHQPLYVQMEMKSGVTTKNAEDFFAAIEAEILSVWPRSRVLTPDDVRGDAATLREALATTGWPTLGATRQKIFFGFDESGPLRDAYTRGGAGLAGRLAFIDSAPADAFAGVAIVNDAKDSAAIDAALAAGMLVRVFGAAVGDDPADNEAALASGAHVLSTDYPGVEPDPVRALTIPGGTPSRCNPRTAPPDCRPEDIEDPAFMR